MDIRVQDILVMKKAHPCGDKRWEVMRTGMDFRLRCLGCGHEVMLPRSKAEKNIRQVLRDGALRNSPENDERQAAIPEGIATCFLRPPRYTLSMDNRTADRR